MATLVKMKIYSALFSFLFASSVFAREGILPEIPDRHVLDAYKSYWQSFDEYEKRLISEGQSKYQNSWSDLKRKYEKRYKQMTICFTTTQKYVPIPLFS